MKKKVVFLVLLSLVAICTHAQTDTVMLPNGWRLSPAGKHIELGDLPLNIAISRDSRWLAVTNNGYGRQSVDIIDLRQEKKVCSETIRSSWYGLCFSRDNRHLYASAGNANKIMKYDMDSHGMLSLADSIVLGKPWPTRISPAGIAIHPKKDLLYVVTRWDNSLYVYDLDNKSLKLKVPLGGEGYQVAFSRDGRLAFISCWGKGQLLVWDTEKELFVSRIDVGSHPNEICVDDRHNRVFVANANDNTVSVVNLKEQRVEETLNTAILLGSLSGSTSNGLCLLNHGHWLAVANADNNCLTLFDVSTPGQSRSIGFIPTGWYPTNVKSVGGKIYVTDGKGLRSFANPNGPSPVSRSQKFEHHKGDANKTEKVQYIAGLFLGSLSIIPQPDLEELETYTRQVVANTPAKDDSLFMAARSESCPIPAAVGQPSPIKYVFYVIKENRTYDQVLGDLPQGNGDSSLVLFDRRITPNQHKLAEEFVLLDNFYVNAEVSCDGHNWSMGAYATDWLEKTWPSNYSSRGDIYSGEGGHHMGNNRDGFIWDNCSRYGVSYRSYGEFVSKSNGTLKPSVPALLGHFCKHYPSWDLGVRDTVRFNRWKEDFDSLLVCGSIPRLSIIRMGNDHTEGMKVGKPTPFSHVADNDLAVGLLIEHLSHSPIWKESAVFILEDDAQNGPDHVDAHRSTAYLAGGFVKRGFVDHTPYSTTSMIHTMELILGLPPMTQYDALARPMWTCFADSADVTPFNHLPCNVNLDDKNSRQKEIAYYQRLCEGYDFDKEDAVPDVEFNQVLWHGIKGAYAQYPPIRRSAFLTYSAEEDEDDD